MPQPISAQVIWDTTLDKGTVADITVPSGNGATVIQWSCGPNVASFTISALDPNEFSPSASQTDVTNFSTTDRDDTAQDYTYTVHAVHAPTGRRSSHDPKIINEP